MIKFLLDDLMGLAESGFSVYAPKKLTTYCYIVDKNGSFCYAQYNYVGGWQMSTCTVPDRQNGSGSVVFSDLSKISEQSVIDTINSTLGDGVKWKGFQQFQSKNWQKLVKYI
jgi:hypothetical protein